MGQQMDTTRLGLAVAFSAAPFVLQLPLGGVMQGKIAGHVPSENVEMPPVPATKADTQWNREGSALHCPHGNGGEEKMEDSNDLENICPNKGHALSDKATSVVIGAKAPKNRWKVPIKDSRQDAAMQRYIAAMRAHFEEVDQFELLTEVPCKEDRAVGSSHLSSCSDRDSHDRKGDMPEQLPDKVSPQAPLVPVPQTALLDQASSSRECDLLAPPARGATPQRHILASQCVNRSAEKPETATDTHEEKDPATGTGDTLPEVQEAAHHVMQEPGKATAFEVGSRLSLLQGVSHTQSSRRRSCIIAESTDNIIVAKRHPQPSMLSRLSQRMSIGLSDALQKLGLVGRQSSFAVLEDRQPGIQEEVDGELTITDSCPRTAPRWAPIQDPSTVSKLQLDSSQVARERATPCLTTKGSRFPDPTSPSQQLEDTENVQQAEASGQEQPHQVKTVGSDHDFINRKISSPTVDLGLATQPETSLQGTEDATNPVPPLIQLLQLCNQEVDVEKLPSMERLLGEHIDLSSIHKIGEGTFGEAFRSGNTVFKIVPIEGDLQVNGADQKKATDILAEVAIALTLSELRAGLSTMSCPNATSAFAETHGVGVCKGRYAADLIREWEAWDRKHESENDPLDAFPESQLHIVFVVADGGIDLEHFDQCTLTEAKSILQQVALALAVAEEACQFEHRDLHWGNLLIQRVPLTHKADFKLRGTLIEVPCQGVLVTLIDFTLSRIKSLTGEVLYCDLSTDPDLFKGPKGDCQAETYRRMKKLAKNRWHTFLPSTNCLWLHYLADIILTQKLKPGKSNAQRDLRSFRKDVLQAKCAADAAFHTYFHGAWLAKDEACESSSDLTHF